MRFFHGVNSLHTLLSFWNRERSPSVSGTSPLGPGPSFLHDPKAQVRTREGGLPSLSPTSWSGRMASLGAWCALCPGSLSASLSRLEVSLLTNPQILTLPWVFFYKVCNNLRASALVSGALYSCGPGAVKGVGGWDGLF